MQIHRLLEIVYILFDKKTVTANDLATHFEVSTRTIYRDIDTLSSAGIPIYTNKGKGGGISLLESYVLNKSLLSDTDQINILSSLHSMKALDIPDIDPVLQRLSSLFDKTNTRWIDIDFSHWGSSLIEKEKFNLLKNGIINQRRVQFEYYSAFGVQTLRKVEALKLVFKGRAWYIYGFCIDKQDYRIFRVTRMRSLQLTDETFVRSIPDTLFEKMEEVQLKFITLVLQIHEKMAYRVFDEFEQECIQKCEDGSFIATVTLPEDEWIYGYILSFGDGALVVEPQHVKESIQQKLKKSLENYL